MKRYLQRLLLDNRFDFRANWFVRSGGEFMIGAKASFPTAVTDDQDSYSRWWMESFGLFLGPCAIYFFFSKRMIPDAPTYQEVS